MAHRIYSDDELRGFLRAYEPLELCDASDVRTLARTALVVLQQRDEARAACVELAGRPLRTDSEALMPARDAIAAAVQEPHGDAVDRLIDAVITIVDYLDHGARGPAKERT